MKHQTRRALLTTAVVCVGLLTLGAARASAAPCSEIAQAIAWNQQSSVEMAYPVRAYMTKHYGFGAVGETYPRDTVHYAADYVYASGVPTPTSLGPCSTSSRTPRTSGWKRSRR